MLISETKKGDWITYKNECFIVMEIENNFTHVLNVETGTFTQIYNTEIVKFISRLEHHQDTNYADTFGQLSIGDWFTTQKDKHSSKADAEFIKLNDSAYCLYDFKNDELTNHIIIISKDENVYTANSFYIHFPEGKIKC